MKICPQCHYESSIDEDFCPSDGCRMQVIQPKESVSITQKLQKLACKPFNKNKSILPKQLENDYEVSSSVFPSLAFDKWLVHKLSDENTKYYYIRYKSDRLSTESCYRQLQHNHSKQLPHVVEFGVVDLEGSHAQYELIQVSEKPAAVNLEQYFNTTEPSEERALYIIKLLHNLIQSCVASKLLPVVLQPDWLMLDPESDTLSINNAGCFMTTGDEEQYRRVTSKSLLCCRIYTAPELSFENILTSKNCVYSIAQIIAEARFGKPIMLSAIQIGAIPFDSIHNPMLNQILKGGLWHRYPERFSVEQFLSQEIQSTPEWASLHPNASSYVFYFNQHAFWKLEDLLTHLKNEPQCWDQAVSLLDDLLKWAESSRYANELSHIYQRYQLGTEDAELTLCRILMLVRGENGVFYRDLDLNNNLALNNLIHFGQRCLKNKTLSNQMEALFSLRHI